jgi:hypothetical protein
MWISKLCDIILTFEEGAWFFNTIHRLDVVDICAKLF